MSDSAPPSHTSKQRHATPQGVVRDAPPPGWAKGGTVLPSLDLMQRRKSRAAHPTKLSICPLAILYLSLLIMRVPVVLGDFIRLIECGRLPYLQALNHLPPDLIRPLGRRLIGRSGLEDHDPPSFDLLWTNIRHFASTFTTVYTIDIPELNSVPVLWRCVRQMLLPPPFYVAARNLAVVVNLPTHAHKASGVSSLDDAERENANEEPAADVDPQSRNGWNDVVAPDQDDSSSDVEDAASSLFALLKAQTFQEWCQTKIGNLGKFPRCVLLMACVLVITKMRYGLDEKAKGRSEKGNIAGAAPLKEWILQLQSVLDKNGADVRNFHRPDRDPLDMDEKELDAYLTHVEQHWVLRDKNFADMDRKEGGETEMIGFTNEDDIEAGRLPELEDEHDAPPAPDGPSPNVIFAEHCDSALRTLYPTSTLSHDSKAQSRAELKRLSKLQPLQRPHQASELRQGSTDARRQDNEEMDSEDEIDHLFAEDSRREVDQPEDGLLDDGQLEDGQLEDGQLEDDRLEDDDYVDEETERASKRRRINAIISHRTNVARAARKKDGKHSKNKVAKMRKFRDKARENEARRSSNIAGFHREEVEKPKTVAGAKYQLLVPYKTDPVGAPPEPYEIVLVSAAEVVGCPLMMMDEAVTAVEHVLVALGRILDPELEPEWRERTREKRRRKRMEAEKLKRLRRRRRLSKKEQKEAERMRLENEEKEIKRAKRKAKEKLDRKMMLKR
ncbi:unnamed protein product [Tilletia controversa]|nr:unnamed protein product [Tilletia controversa]